MTNQTRLCQSVHIDVSHISQSVRYSSSGSSRQSPSFNSPLYHYHFMMFCMSQQCSLSFFMIFIINLFSTPKDQEMFRTLLQSHNSQLSNLNISSFIKDQDSEPYRSVLQLTISIIYMNPVLIQVYFCKLRWPDLPHFGSNLSCSLPRLIHGILFLQTNTLALLLHLHLPCLLW